MGVPNTIYAGLVGGRSYSLDVLEEVAMRKRITRCGAIVSLCTVLAACTTHTTEERRVADSSKAALAWPENLERERRVNENWSAYCTTDQVTTVKRCYAGTFGQSMGNDGQPYGSKNIPFQVYFLDTSGPFLMVGYHTFPGRTPTIRVDDLVPIQVHNDAGITALRPDPELVEALRTGSVVKARYHVWPDRTEDMLVKLQGFEEAWQKLNQLRP